MRSTRSKNAWMAWWTSLCTRPFYKTEAGFDEIDFEGTWLTLSKPAVGRRHSLFLLRLLEGAKAYGSALPADSRQ
jgi:hypothetical protein